METVNPVNIYQQKINMINNRVSAKMSAAGISTGFSGILRDVQNVQDAQNAQKIQDTEDAQKKAKAIKSAVKGLGISGSGVLMNSLSDGISSGSALTDALFGINSGTGSLMSSAVNAYMTGSNLTDSLLGLNSSSVAESLLGTYKSSDALEKILTNAVTNALLSETASSAASYKSGADSGVFDQSRINPNAEISKHTEYEYLIGKAAEKYGVSDVLIKAIIKAESDFNPESVSGAGAVGLMQLMPGTAELMGVKNSYDPEENINGGVGYFKQQLDSFGGDIKMALAAYNCGPTRLNKLGITSLDNSSDFAKLPKETQNYVNKIINSIK